MWTAVLACLLLVGSTATAVAVGPGYVSVSAMSVSDDEPTVGDAITVTPTVRYSGSGSGSFEVTEVQLKDASGTTYAEADDLGTLGPGETIDVPLGATLQTAGQRKLVVHVRGVVYDSKGRWSTVTHAKHPLYVTVSEPSTSTETKPQLNVETERLTEGSESTVRVMVSNGDDEALNNLSLQLSGIDGAQTKLQPTLGPQNATTFQFDVQPSASGSHQLNATLQYGDGNAVSTVEPVEVAPLQNDVAVYATRGQQNGTDVLRYRVTNHGNAPLQNVVVSGAAVGTPFPTTVIQRVAAGSSATTTVELNERPTGAATVSATYQIGSTTGQSDQSVQFDDPTSTASATPTPDSTETQNRRLPAGPLPFLTGGVVATGSILGYRTWRDN